MIRIIIDFRCRGLRDLFLHERTSGAMAEHVRRLRYRLAVIDTASKVTDINMPGYKLHPLVGERDGIWATSVSGDWRTTFKFVNGDAYTLDYEDYH